MTKGSNAQRSAAIRRRPYHLWFYRLGPCRHSVAVLAVFFSAIGPTFADLLQGQVVRVSDGDTVVVEDETGVQHKIRLLGIDAPESAQAYGPAATEFLRNRALGAPATVHWQVRDRYQRLVGQVFVNAEDLGLGQIRAGLAWHYRAYAKDQAANDRHAYAVAELAARAEGQGLWAGTELTPPWDWRRMLRSQPRTQKPPQTQSAATPQTPSLQPHWTN